MVAHTLGNTTITFTSCRATFRRYLLCGADERTIGTASMILQLATVLYRKIALLRVEIMQKIKQTIYILAKKSHSNFEKRKKLRVYIMLSQEPVTPDTNTSILSD